jgi:hypothetical protein
MYVGSCSLRAKEWHSLYIIHYNEIRCCPLYMFFMQQFFEKCTVGSCIEYIPGTVTNNMKCCIFLIRKQD